MRRLFPSQPAGEVRAALDGALSHDPDRPEARATLGAVPNRSTLALPGTLLG